MGHAEQRAFERLVHEAGYEPGDARALVDYSRRRALDSVYASEAVLLARLKRRMGDRARSNGDQVWIIIRNQTLVTLFFRRSSQPSDATAFGVESVCVDDQEALWEAVIRGVHDREREAEELRELHYMRS